MKGYADSKLKVKQLNLKVDDLVLVKQNRLNKTYSIFDPDPYIVDSIKGNMIIARRGDHLICRNVSFFKKYFGKRLVPPISSNKVREKKSNVNNMEGTKIDFYFSDFDTNNDSIQNNLIDDFETNNDSIQNNLIDDFETNNEPIQDILIEPELLIQENNQTEPKQAISSKITTANIIPDGQIRKGKYQISYKLTRDYKKKADQETSPNQIRPCGKTIKPREDVISKISNNKK